MRAACTAATTGHHTVTGTVDVRGRQVTGTADLLVTPRLGGLVVRPADALVEVGHGIRYTATGLDAVGRPVIDLTSWAVFTVGPSGSCVVSTCTPARTGEHVVTGTVDLGDRDVSGTASLRAIPAISGLQVLPATATLTAGDAITFTVQGLDAAGLPVVDLTDEAVVGIDPDGSCDGATCTATRAGPHTVAATVTLGDREVTGSVPLVVTAGPLVTLTVAPAGDDRRRHVAHLPRHRDRRLGEPGRRPHGRGDVHDRPGRLLLGCHLHRHPGRSAHRDRLGGAGRAHGQRVGGGRRDARAHVRAHRDPGRTGHRRPGRSSTAPPAATRTATPPETSRAAPPSRSPLTAGATGPSAPLPPPARTP